MKKEREMLRNFAQEIMKMPYVIGETKPCQHYNVTVNGDYCNECNAKLKRTKGSGG